MQVLSNTAVGALKALDMEWEECWRTRFLFSHWRPGGLPICDILVSTKICTTVWSSSYTKVDAQQAEL